MNAPPVVPKILRTNAMSRRPAAWPIRMAAAMLKPKTVENARNMIRLALVVAASARSPRKRPTQAALIDPFRDLQHAGGKRGQREQQQRPADRP